LESINLPSTFTFLPLVSSLFHPLTLVSSITFSYINSLCHLISLYHQSIFNGIVSINLSPLFILSFSSINHKLIFNQTYHQLYFYYLFDISAYLIIPLYSYVKLYLYSFDVIHTFGIYSWGSKIDAIPGRINLASTIRLLEKGEYIGYCYELCGQGHLSMYLISRIV
jgi:heme/copper-type cytochrome/quinol oxidase subunit 2